MPRFTVKYAPEALEEIRQAIDYYNGVSAGLGNRFKQNLLETVKSVKLNPSYNSFRYDGVRFGVVKNFPMLFTIQRIWTNAL